MQAIEHVIASLECASATGDDLTEAFYAAYFRRCPESRALLEHTDATVRGRMLEGVFEILLIDDAEEQRRCIAFEVKTHRGYGARRHMYAHLFDALQEVVRDACGESWCADWDRAWRERSGAMLEEIEPRAVA